MNYGLVKSKANAKRRAKIAEWLRDLHSVPTESLTPKEKNQAIRSHVKHAIKRRVI